MSNPYYAQVLRRIQVLRMVNIYIPPGGLFSDIEYRIIYMSKVEYFM